MFHSHFYSNFIYIWFIFQSYYIHISFIFTFHQYSFSSKFLFQSYLSVWWESVWCPALSFTWSLEGRYFLAASQRSRCSLICNVSLWWSLSIPVVSVLSRIKDFRYIPTLSRNGVLFWLWRYLHSDYDAERCVGFIRLALLFESVFIWIIERQTDREIDRDRQIKTENLRHLETHTEKDRQAYRKRDRHRQIMRHTEKDWQREIRRETDR